jgi:hypothetical protein
VGLNPGTVLPVNLDVSLDLDAEPLEGHIIVNLVSPCTSIKEADTSELWTEVVRRGENRSKTRSRKEKKKIVIMIGAF